MEGGGNGGKGERRGRSKYFEILFPMAPGDTQKLSCEGHTNSGIPEHEFFAMISLLVFNIYSRNPPRLRSKSSGRQNYYSPTPLVYGVSEFACYPSPNNSRNAKVLRVST